MKPTPIYFDNAATTPLDPKVLEAMLPFLSSDFGNPSSTHSFGRKTRAAIEAARKQIAGFLNASPGEIIFTSGGTEADNIAVHSAIYDLGVKHIISSPLEHHAILHTVEVMASREKIKLSMVKVDGEGRVDLQDLENLLSLGEKAFVSLMHANNEIGTLLPLEKVGEMCEKYGAIFHSDTVQTMGHYSLDVKMLKAHFLSCSAHKFHGPKGVGFLYKQDKLKIHSLLQGGSQERGYRAGTENVSGIIGLAKAFEIAHEGMLHHQQEVTALKEYLKAELQKAIPGVKFNGATGNESLYTVLNVSLPPHENGEMLLFTLDLNGVASSGGSACSSGSNKGSHVLTGIGADPSRPGVRFSFSKYNTFEEADRCVEVLKNFYKN